MSRRAKLKPPPVAGSPELTEPAPVLDDDERALLASVAEQAELLALLTGSVRAGLGPLDGVPPPGAVDLVGALGSLEDPTTPGSDPLSAFATVTPRFVRDAEDVVRELGAA